MEEKKEAVATETPQAKPAAPQAKEEKKEGEKKEDAPAPAIRRGKGSRPKQCSACSKNLKKKTWYYRDNKYFCNKRCWKASKVPKEAAA